MSVSKQELINALAIQLKSIIKKPEWADFVKTGVFKERPPMDADWWYARAASMLLKIQRLGPVGVSKLRTKYGGRKNRGVAPEHFFRGSGKIIRTILQQLDAVGLTKQDKKGQHKGRVLTSKAVSLISKAAKQLEKPRQKAAEKPVKPAEKPVEKQASEKPAEKKEPKKEEVKKEAAESKDSELSATKLKEVKKEEKKEEVKKEEPKAQPATDK
jgi:small subunit ribosomal protein S19e